MSWSNLNKKRTFHHRFCKNIRFSNTRKINLGKCTLLPEQTNSMSQTMLTQTLATKFCLSVFSKSSCLRRSAIKQWRMACPLKCTGKLILVLTTLVLSKELIMFMLIDFSMKKELGAFRSVQSTGYAGHDFLLVEVKIR